MLLLTKLLSFITSAYDAYLLSNQVSSINKYW